MTTRPGQSMQLSQIPLRPRLRAGTRSVPSQAATKRVPARGRGRGRQGGGLQPQPCRRIRFGKGAPPLSLRNISPAERGRKQHRRENCFGSLLHKSVRRSQPTRPPSGSPIKSGTVGSSLRQPMLPSRPRLRAGTRSVPSQSELTTLARKLHEPLSFLPPRSGGRCRRQRGGGSSLSRVVVSGSARGRLLCHCVTSPP